MANAESPLIFAVFARLGATYTSTFAAVCGVTWPSAGVVALAPLDGVTPLVAAPVAGIAPLLDGATSVAGGVPVACWVDSVGGVVAGPALGCGVRVTCAPLLGWPVGLTVVVAEDVSETAPFEVDVVVFFVVSLVVVCCAAAGSANAASITAASA
jgi:hypothetical protein